MEALVYIIIVNYNGYEDTLMCVRSLQNINYNNYRIIIVDNGSNDAKTLRNDVFLNEAAKIIYAEENNGFSAGNNIGISYAQKHNADYVLLLNNDTVVSRDFLDALIKCAEHNTDAGIVTGRIYYYSKPDQLWYSGGEYNRMNGFTNQILFDENILEEQEITFASGCLMLISGNCMNTVGELDDKFFLYSEDTDYCCRVVNEGFKIIWTPQCRIFHKVSSSVKDSTALQQYYITRNNLYIIRKYCNKRVWSYCCRTFQCLKDILKRRMTIRSMCWAYIDFWREKDGKCNRIWKSKK